MKPMYSFEKVKDFSSSERKSARKDKKTQRTLDREDTFALLIHLSLIDENNHTINDLDSLLDTMKTEERVVIKSFVSNNLINIRWYELKIDLENRYRLGYAWATAILIFSVPAIIGYATFFSDDFKYEGASLIGTSLTVMLSALIGVHKLISSWIEKRKYRSHFFQAKVDLQNLLFDMDEKFELLSQYAKQNTPAFTTPDSDTTASTPTGTENQEDSNSIDENKKPTLNYSLSVEMMEELNDAIRASRTIVQEETKVFFEMSATTTFDLGSLLSQSGATAKSLISTFKSHGYDLDKIKAAEEKAKAAEKNEKVERVTSEISMKAISIKLQRLTNKEMLLLEEFYELKKDKEANATQIKQLSKEIDLLQIEIENQEIEFMTQQELLSVSSNTDA